MSKSGLAVQWRDIRAITFDVGGTLITPWPSVGHIYAEVAAAHGHAGLDPTRLNQRFATAWRAVEDFRHTRQQWAELVDATFSGLMAKPPSATFFDALYDRFAEAGAWHVFEDVIPALDALKACGFKLGVISNWDDRLRPLLQELHLEAYFETMSISCEVGATKPARVMFTQAAEGLSMPPGAMLHVGDSLEMDVRGAEAAGCVAVWLDRHTNPTRAGAIRTLQELVTGA
ncbi:MAG TPA: HAD-IA family hydrolase [Candidatus Limnocylindrales bacterium]|nr:HAD-IA family hydrolase [Candidatus Limnocylindrales bacterium]